MGFFLKTGAGIDFNILQKLRSPPSLTRQLLLMSTISLHYLVCPSLFNFILRPSQSVCSDREDYWICIIWRDRCGLPRRTPTLVPQRMRENWQRRFVEPLQSHWSNVDQSFQAESVLSHFPGSIRERESWVSLVSMCLDCERITAGVSLQLCVIVILKVWLWWREPAPPCTENHENTHLDAHFSTKSTTKTFNCAP